MAPRLRVKPGVTDVEAEERESRRCAQGLQLLGLTLVAVGLGAIRWYIGLAVFGVGLLLVGISQEIE